MLQKTTVTFLKDLKKNNNREWFEANRKTYENAKADFSALIENVIKSYGSKDDSIAYLKAKDCLFRINRDIRFSKDKSPYKTNMGASISKGGKKSLLAGYYFHCEPGQSFVGGGIWMPAAAELKKVRQEIDYNFEEFKNIITYKDFVRIYNDLESGKDVSLQRPPKGYEEENPAIKYLKLKSYVATSSLPDEALTDKNFTTKITDAFTALMPLINFINKALEN